MPFIQESSNLLLYIFILSYFFTIQFIERINHSIHISNYKKDYNMHNFVENVDNFSRNKNEKSVSYAAGIIPDIQYTQSKVGS